MRKITKIICKLGGLTMFAMPLLATISCNREKSSISANGTFVIDKNNFKARLKAKAALANGQVTAARGWKTVLALAGAQRLKNDGTFNQSSYEGMVAATSIIPKRANDYVKPAQDDESGFVSMYAALPQQSLIIAPGFLHRDKLSSKKGIAAIANKAVILLGADVQAKNIAAVVFKSHESGFLAGYMAGHYLNNQYEEFKAGGLKVATYGGMYIPGVTPFMAGFQNGVKYFNANKDPQQEAIIFIDNGAKSDYFTNSFAPGDGKAMAEKLVRLGADLIFPVTGGGQKKDVATAIKTARSKAKMIGTDVAQELDPAFPMIVFSALKNLKVAVTKMIEIVSGTKDKTDEGYAGFEGFGGKTIGTVDNGLAGVSQGRKDDMAAARAYSQITSAVKEAAKSEQTNPLVFKY